MASLAQAAPSVRQPVLTALAAVISALKTFAIQNNVAAWPPPASGAQGATSDTNSSLYLQVARFQNTLQLLVANISGSQSAKNTTRIGGTLYEVAAQYYGDPTQAFALMEFDGFITPQLPNSVDSTINLPPGITAAPATGISAAQVTP